MFAIYSLSLADKLTSRKQVLGDWKVARTKELTRRSAPKENRILQRLE
jgi:hypothetical protein